MVSKRGPEPAAMMHRRELLQAFLGLPAVLSACSRKGGSVPPLPAGEIVFGSEVIGHRIRDLGAGRQIEIPAERWESVPVVIIGGGVAGLAAAWRLLRAGCSDFVLLELEEAAGGTARSGTSSAGPHPWGAHYITAPQRDNRALVTLLGELGIYEGMSPDGEPIVGEGYLCRAPEERVFYRGFWYEELYLEAGASAEDLRQRAAFEDEIGRLCELRDARGRRAFALPLGRSSDDAELTALDNISMEAWMDARGFTSPRLRWYVDYACRDDYGLALADTSAWAGLFYFASRLKARASDYQPVITWPDGNGHLVAQLAAKAGARVRLGWAIADMRPAMPAPGHDSKEQVHWDILALTEGARVARGLRAEQVIFAVPQFLARHLIAPYREREPAHIRAFDYGAWMVANLTVRDRPSGRGFPLAWDNVIYESPSLGYVVSTHQRGLDHGPTVLTYYYPLLDSDSRAGRRRLLELGWEECAEIVLSDLERPHRDIRTLATRVDIARWGHGMIRPRPGFVWGKARRDALRPYRGIHFAHSDLSGVALFEEALDNGVRAAEEVLAARAIAFETWRG